MMLQGMGSVASSCGVNPCGLMDSLFPSSACETWQTCAAVANQEPVGVFVSQDNCIAGGLDENGNTIVSCGAPDVSAPNPAVMSSSVGFPQWALLGGIALLALMIARR